jgi:hypothetical protein
MWQKGRSPIAGIDQHDRVRFQQSDLSLSSAFYIGPARPARHVHAVVPVSGHPQNPGGKSGQSEPIFRK